MNNHPISKSDPLLLDALLRAVRQGAKVVGVAATAAVGEILALLRPDWCDSPVNHFPSGITRGRERDLPEQGMGSTGEHFPRVVEVSADHHAAGPWVAVHGARESGLARIIVYCSPRGCGG